MKIKIITKIQKATALAAVVLTAALPYSRANVVTDWNQTAIQVSKANAPFTGTPQNTNVGTRIHAIVAIAVYDAINAVLQLGESYLYNTPAASSSEDAAKAAAAQAARDVLVNYYPAAANVTELNNRLALTLATIPDGPDKNAGIAAGSAAAAAIIAARVGDGSGASVSYPGGTGVGQWRPTPGTAAAPFTFPAASTPQCGGVTPFVLPTANIFRPGPPPAVGSAVYNKAAAEVRTIGKDTSTRRSVDQTHIAQFWRQDAEIPVNQAARLLVDAHNLSLYESAYVFLVLDLAIADARIAAYEAKYHYGFWRPVTALNANPDGTVANNYASWLPLNVTPSHPAYPAGTPSAASAGFTVLRHFFGDDFSFTLTSSTATPNTRNFQSLSQAETEAGLSRNYGGIHWRFDITEAQILAQKVAAYVLVNGPQPND